MLKKALKNIAEEGIGRVEFYAVNSIPSYALQLNGQTVLKADYPELAAAAAGTQGFTITDTEITIPDYSDRFVRVTSLENTVGARQEQDTKLEGGFTFFQDNLGPIVNSSGKFKRSETTEEFPSLQRSSTDLRARNNIFYSGQETRPQNIAVVACIKARPLFDIDNLVFKDTADFSELNILQDGNFLLLENAQKISYLNLENQLSGQAVTTKDLKKNNRS